MKFNELYESLLNEGKNRDKVYDILNKAGFDRAQVTVVDDMIGTLVQLRAPKDEIDTLEKDVTEELKNKGYKVGHAVRFPRPDKDGNSKRDMRVGKH